MFQKLGPARTPRDDRRLAGYLAFIAGAVNSAGFAVLGSFTSHVTGNIGRVADETATGHAPVAALAAAAVVAYFAGAITASMVIESRVFGAMSRTSAALLAFEALLVATFIATTTIFHFEGTLRAHEIHAMLLSLAMGIQNSLVTRLSGAVVRTTHLTGVMTDLGIETARWFRYWRAKAGEGRIRLTVTSTPATRPPAAKSALLATIFGAFVIGSGCGAILAVRYASLSLLPVVALLVAGAIYAGVSGRSVVVEAPRRPADSEPDFPPD